MYFKLTLLAAKNLETRSEASESRSESGHIDETVLSAS